LTQGLKKQIQPVSGSEKAFGQALRLIREERKLSQEKLALEAEFDRTYISLIERGVRSPTVRALVRLAEALKVRPSEMILRMEAHLAKGKKPEKKTPKSG
jgi:transcriptional regulator with XRE-family HTH domain